MHFLPINLKPRNCPLDMCVQFWSMCLSHLSIYISCTSLTHLGILVRSHCHDKTHERNQFQKEGLNDSLNGSHPWRLHGFGPLSRQSDNWESVSEQSCSLLQGRKQSKGKTPQAHALSSNLPPSSLHLLKLLLRYKSPFTMNPLEDSSVDEACTIQSHPRGQISELCDVR